MTFNKFLVRPLVVALAFALCGVPEALAQAQQAQSTAPAPQTGASQDSAQQPVEPATAGQQQNWPTQDSAPNAAAPSTTAPNTPAPATTAPNATSPNATPAPADNAQQSAPTQPSTTPDASGQRVVLGPGGQTQPPTAQQNRGTTVDPSAGPIAPPPSTQSSSPTATPEDQSQLPVSPAPQTQTEQKPAAKQAPSPEPLGTAAAEGVNTAGNGASRPAGSAIAPAKQGRKRSLLIKLGAIAAVGVAVGTVAALSRGTPGNPPNTSASASTAK
jgi:hypothetical protein